MLELCINICMNYMECQPVSKHEADWILVVPSDTVLSDGLLAPAIWYMFQE